MNVSEAIRNRRSVRKYKAGETVPQEHIEQIIEAAMFAPSAHNGRPWEFVVVENREILDEIRQMHPYAAMLETASAAIIMCIREEKLKGERPNLFLQQDCGAATQNLLLEAAALGYGTCWCGVYPREEITQKVKSIIKTENTPFNIIALGVPDEKPNPRGSFEKERISYIR